MEALLWKGPSRGGLLTCHVFERHVFVCHNMRPADAPRPSCTRNGQERLAYAAETAKPAKQGSAQGADQQSGCLDQCEHGPTVVVYPDAVWYGHVQPEDAAEIVEEHLIGGVRWNGCAWQKNASTARVVHIESERREPRDRGMGKRKRENGVAGGRRLRGRTGEQAKRKPRQNRSRNEERESGDEIGDEAQRVFEGDGSGVGCGNLARRVGAEWPLQLHRCRRTDPVAGSPMCDGPQSNCAVRLPGRESCAGL